MKPTAQQTAILEFIQEFRERHGVPPTQREIQEHFGFASRFSVVKHLTALRKKGLLDQTDGRARGLVPTMEAPRGALVNIPLLGMIPAGMPADQMQEAGQSIAVDAGTLGLSRAAGTFALKVRGDSMIDAGILDRDTVILELREPRHGDIVAALIDGETTLKRYLLQDGRPFLRAENERYPDLIPVSELIIQGVFRALIRTV